MAFTVKNHHNPTAALHLPRTKAVPEHPRALFHHLQLLLTEVVPRQSREAQPFS